MTQRTRRPGLLRRQWLGAAGLLALGGLATRGLQAAPAPLQDLPVVQSLPDELARALQANGPLLVMVSLRGCPFCKIASQNYLLPLARQQGLAIVQIDMRSRQMIQTFGGAQQTQAALSRAWGIKVAPTVLFFGRGGAEVAERLEGGYLPDFYGVYLDERVRTARAAVQS